MNNYQTAILGTGWLGMALAKSLISDGFRVCGSTTTSGKLQILRAAGIKPYLIDIGNPSYILPDKFLHAGWMVVCLPPAALRDGIGRLTSELSEFPHKKILLISSTAVYPATGKVVTESDAAHQISSHSGIDMLALENAMSALGQCTILRLGGLYGEGRHPGRFLAGKTGLKNGDAPVNLIHQDDAVNIARRILDRNPGAMAFNGVSPTHPSRKEFYTEAALSQGLQPPEFINEESTVQYKIVNSDRVREVLDYTFLHPDPLMDI